MIYSKSPITGMKKKSPPKKNSDIVTLKKFSMKVRFLTIFFLITPPLNPIRQQVRCRSQRHSRDVCF